MEHYEILFKAKTCVGDKWIEGDFVHERINQYSEATNVNIRIKGTSSHEVRPSTICQYTGLKDKNDNKIFEGDKLLYLITNVGTVEINPLKGVFATGFECYISSDSFEKCEIIGNIHDKN